MTTSRAMTPIEHMHNAGAERTNGPMALGELERRWQAVRASMEDAGVDLLLVHSHSSGIGGAVRWFSDRPTGGGYPTTLVFSAREPMTLIAHGPMDGDRAVSPEDPANYGIHRMLSTASFSSAHFSQYYDADLALDALRAPRPRRVGLVAPSQMPYPFVDRVRTGLPGIEFVDFSDAIDSIKSVKSAHEQETIAATAALQDEVLAYGFSIIEPGMRDSQVAGEMQRYGSERGSEDGLYMVGSAPIGEPAMFQLRHTQERVIQAGDAITINLENSGRGGYFTHVGRNAVLGKPSQQLLEEFEIALEAQRLITDLLVPGAVAADVVAAYQEFLRSHDLPPERRLFCHGQGYDLVERPLVREDESMVIQAGMNIGCHPMWVRDGVCVFTNDNYLVGVDGPPRRLHTFPQRVVELG